MRNDYPLVLASFDDGEGRIVYCIGWDISTTDTEYEIASVLEPASDAEWVACGINTIPVSAVIHYRVLKPAMPKSMRQ